MNSFFVRNRVLLALLAIGTVFSFVVGFKSSRGGSCPSCLPGLSCPVPQGR